MPGTMGLFSGPNMPSLQQLHNEGNRLVKNRIVPKTQYDWSKAFGHYNKWCLFYEMEEFPLMDPIAGNRKPSINVELMEHK